MRKTILFAASAAAIAFMAGCKTINVDKELVSQEAVKPEGVEDAREDEQQSAHENTMVYIENEMKTVDIPKTVVYVEKPVYQPAPEPDEPKKTGAEAVNAALKEAVKSPERYVHGAMYYDYDPDFVYEIYCQPYRVTDLVLEPGEQVLEMPFLSENQVWVLGAGVSQYGSSDVQHFFIKPIYTKLTTTMIIITDKRVYHLLLKSFKDSYMSIVRWNYPASMPFTVKTDAIEAAGNINRLSKSTDGVDPRFLSFDYKMTYSIFRKPLWLPTLVYDDGRRTYIRMNEIVLNRASPVLFNKRNELINYRVNGSLIVIDTLIDKVTLKYGKEKVVITKKHWVPENPAYIPDMETAEDVSKDPAKADGQDRAAGGGVRLSDNQAEMNRKYNIESQRITPVKSASETGDSSQ